jgi:hypothetical protein
MSGKKLFILMIVSGITIILGSFLILGYDKTWRIWNIPTKQPIFYDLRLIAAGAESYSKGYDPAYNNPFDPEQRLFNYPRIWYLVFASGINQNSTVILGILLALSFFVSIGTLRGEIDKTTATIQTMIVFSPAVLLGIERGNVDILIFVLLAIALFIKDYSKTLSLVVLLLSIALKIFPIFGIGYLLDGNRRSIKYIIIGILSTAAYMLFSLDDMRHIFSVTQKGVDVSYGVSVLPTKLSPYLGDYFTTVKLLLFILAIVLIMISWCLALRNKDQILNLNSHHLSMFRLAAAIYIGTFLLGNNWDYRLMFIIFAIPQIVVWAHEKHSFSSTVAKICLAAGLVSCWYLEIWRLFEFAGLAGRLVTFTFDEVANWVLFIGLVYLYTKSLPQWILDLIPNKLHYKLAHNNQEIKY